MSLLTLTTRSDETEFVSQYTRHKPNNVWSDLKHLGAHEHAELSNPWSEQRSDEKEKRKMKKEKKQQKKKGRKKKKRKRKKEKNE